MSRSNHDDLGEELDRLARRAAEGDRAAVVRAGARDPAPDVPPCAALPRQSRRCPGRLPGDPDPDRHPPRHVRRSLEVQHVGLHRRDPVASPRRGSGCTSLRCEGPRSTRPLSTRAWGTSTRRSRRPSTGCSPRRSGSAAPTGCSCACRGRSGRHTVLADVLGLTDGEGARNPRLQQRGVPSSASRGRGERCGS